MLMMKNIAELHKYRGTAHLEYNTPTEVSVVFHSGLNYDD